MKPIDHELLDRYEAVKGDLERSPDRNAIDPRLWETVDEILLDLHMINHGYTTDGYARFVERRMQEVCADASVVERMKAIRL